MTTYIHPSAPDVHHQPHQLHQSTKTSSQSVTMQTMPSGSVTAIIAPGGNLATASGQTIQMQPQNIQPQVRASTIIY